VSKYFHLGARTVWNPSNRVADLFVRTGEAIAPLVDLPTGISPTRAGDYDVDPDTFTAFVDGVTGLYLSSSHAVLRSLLEGFLGTSLVMVARAGRPVPALDEPAALDPRDVSVGPGGIGALGDPAALRALAEATARAMPH
jgi:hypothetical protein